MKECVPLRRTALALALLSLSGSALAATCPAYNPSNKANKLYLVFPTAPITYPSFGFSAGSVTNPAAAFSAADLPSYTGTTAALRGAVKHVVELDYCEFNVQVLDTTTLPPATFPRRNIVAGHHRGRLFLCMGQDLPGLDRRTRRRAQRRQLDPGPLGQRDRRHRRARGRA
ncbi:MAG: hypothetical protein JF591_16430 [Lysobacter sp.]|nr:hypothetical protein [Lysobacter sp.]